MKKFFIIFMVLSVTLSSFAQIINADSALYQSKVESYTKMKRTGGTLAIIGGGLTLVSILMVSNANWEESHDMYGNTNYTTSDGGGVFGILGLFVGVPMAVTGIVLSSIGSKKVKYYSEKLKNVKMGMYHNGQQTGVTLVIRF